MKNGKEIVLEATEGGSYNNPKIPKGYVYLQGTWKDGIVIQNIADGSIFTWIPIGYLDEDGTLDGKKFNEKFGRRNFYNSDFSQSGFHEEINQEFIESVKKHGGCYISSCHASENFSYDDSKKELKVKLVFKKGNWPWTAMSYWDAEKAAASYAKDSEDVVSSITSGAVFDSMLSWIVKVGAKTLDEVVKDSYSWGNYINHNGRVVDHKKPTGSNEKWSACNIYDIAGNVDEWTSEQDGDSYQVVRGGNYNSKGDNWPAAVRKVDIPGNWTNYNTSFRVVLYLK